MVSFSEKRGASSRPCTRFHSQSIGNIDLKDENGVTRASKRLERVVPAHGWRAVGHMPLNGLLRKRQRRLAGGTWVMAEAQGSFCLARSRAAKPILRTRSEVYFTGERGGSHGQGGWPYFFFSGPRGPAASSGGAGRWPPLTAHPRPCIQSPGPGPTEPPSPPQVAPHQAWPCAAPRA